MRTLPLLTSLALLLTATALPTASAAKYGCDGTSLLDDVACVPEGAVGPLLTCYGTVEQVAACIVAGETANLERFHDRLCQRFYQCTIG